MTKMSQREAWKDREVRALIMEMAGLFVGTAELAV